MQIIVHHIVVEDFAEDMDHYCQPIHPKPQIIEYINYFQKAS